MPLYLHNLKPAKGAKKNKKRLGRGNASGHGTYSGRGQKGQRARSGGKKGLALKGLKGIIQSTPKLGGFRSLKRKLEIVNIRDLEKNFNDNDTITPEKLAEKGLIKNIKFGVKILGQGKLNKKFTVYTDKISASAKEVIEKNKGKVLIFGSKKEEKLKPNTPK
ncbi:MAG: 50S ribosomal protein L15 [Candidatus Buchananbacteria bacterium RBG_13_39_9]|uniref:Large ribosomal subunit protein uL15 n=1 Tax=Candidatus Buchananbacteria bacterium RBG_13_39_9 TaxID=1797531 RepID=A0A1G1XNI5_9BACT|nr:MAG: 50S ribosomal protein L15 [Candidatus Buchananbacteria bacterium RBG_13_39_9]